MIGGVEWSRWTTISLYQSTSTACTSTNKHFQETSRKSKIYDDIQKYESKCKLVASDFINKENNVFKDALGVKGLGFKHHGNHPSVSSGSGKSVRCRYAVFLFPNT